jgi:hypothetical protein
MGNMHRMFLRFGKAIAKKKPADLAINGFSRVVPER